ncbi:MAG: glycosyltransferase family 39 protein, partial [Candidatus Methanomethylicaceae archaeon]
VGYGLARHYLTNRQAVLSAWLMAISPLLIMYSQELRFYSGLVFFYLLTAFTGIKAIKENRLWNWALFCLVGVLGLAFHIFVFLAVLIVYAHLLTDFSGNRARGALKGLVRSTIILLFALLGLLLVFGRLPKDTWSLVSETHLLRIVLGGVGWAPPFPSDTLGWLYYFTMIAFGIIGLLTWRDWRDPKSSLFLFLALLAQIMAIILFNWIGKYFLAPRQFLFLAPFFGYYTAVGIDRAYQVLSNWTQMYRPSLKQLAPALFFLLLFLFAALALEQYYRLEKGVVKEALPLLQREWQEGDLICVYPELDAVTYAYYWRNQFGASIFPCDELDPEEKANLRFILTPPTWKPLSNSYLIFKPTRPTLNERWIWELPSVR